MKLFTAAGWALRQMLRQPLFGLCFLTTQAVLLSSPFAAFFTLNEYLQLLTDLSLMALLVGLLLFIFLSTPRFFSFARNAEAEPMVLNGSLTLSVLVLSRVVAGISALSIFTILSLPTQFLICGSFYGPAKLYTYIPLTLAGFLVVSLIGSAMIKRFTNYSVSLTSLMIYFILTVLFWGLQSLGTFHLGLNAITRLTLGGGMILSISILMLSIQLFCVRILPITTASITTMTIFGLSFVISPQNRVFQFFPNLNQLWPTLIMKQEPTSVISAFGEHLAYSLPFTIFVIILTLIFTPSN